MPDGRVLACDDRGSLEGTPVLYFHGTPDSRLARHPDDSIAERTGVRLLCPDRPGIGSSDVDPRATPESVCADLARMLDDLGVERASLLAWSAGSIFALALAAGCPDRVHRVVLAAPLVPGDAYGDPSVLDGAADNRRMFADMVATTSADELGLELAPFLVPAECDDATARVLLEDSLRALEPIPRAGETLVTALRASVRQGMTGLARDIAAQAHRFGDRLERITAPLSLHVGISDTVAPPGMAGWLATHVEATIHLHVAGHELGITRWDELLADAVG